MKKFLPLVVFITVFSVVLAGQIGMKIFKDKSKKEEVTKNNYEEIESKYLKTSAKTLEGKKLEFVKIQTPVVVLNFWASWCIPCLEEIPSMIALKKSFPEEALSILAVNSDEEDQRKNIMKTLQKVKHTNEFIIIPDEASRLVTDFNVTAIPVTIIFNRGKVVHLSMGPMDFNSEEIKEKIRKWIK